ncbi:hypothetical protein M0G74_09015 [Microbulbifer sp. CAU 1566]|uniref:hypothetical protein n=1 Tax=Microbulbifer sp. CAU 1566 TaxID=2933269 RepID=UPI00200345B4|nr:hypothetical protein [Microbulbifer sp. CAU 1566]MCK7597406.1 hypothetical protein [Microbulbifer sp. CAU 1566]
MNYHRFTTGRELYTEESGKGPDKERCEPRTDIEDYREFLQEVKQLLREREWAPPPHRLQWSSWDDQAEALANTLLGMAANGLVIAHKQNHREPLPPGEEQASDINKTAELSIHMSTLLRAICSDNNIPITSHREALPSLLANAAFEYAGLSITARSLHLKKPRHQVV